MTGGRDGKRRVRATKGHEVARRGKREREREREGSGDRRGEKERQGATCKEENGQSAGQSLATERPG